MFDRPRLNKLVAWRLLRSVEPNAGNAAPALTLAPGGRDPPSPPARLALPNTSTPALPHPRRQEEQMPRIDWYTFSISWRLLFVVAGVSNPEAGHAKVTIDLASARSGDTQ